MRKYYFPGSNHLSESATPTQIESLSGCIRISRSEESRFADFEEHSRPEGFADDFDKWLDVLTAKYGKAVEDNTTWRNDLFKQNYPKQLGLAIRLGHAVREVKWQTSDSAISLTIKGDNRNVSVIAIYMSLEKIKKDSKTNSSVL